MGAIIPAGQVVWGLQLPIQSQSTRYVQPWEATAGPDELATVAVAADDAGAFYVAVCDHVAVPRPADEAMSTTWYDTVATLGWLAAQTTRTHLLSHVYVLPYRHPLMTLDRLSGGRTILGAGAGHLESEFALLGIDHAARGAAMDAAIGPIRAAFDDEYPTVGGPGAEVGAGMSPRPARPGGPPIWIGGSSKAAITRAARLGDGWLPQGPPKMGMSNAIAHIAEVRAAEGLPAAFDMGVVAGPLYVGTPEFEIEPYATVGTAEQVAERLAKFPPKGINQIQVGFRGRDAAEMADQVRRFGAEVAPLLTA
jgi:alkanesulfonate monooxygenase SsuD/methylene tetrahydromethanopterin reductase-like flavin-dependent oxidoreductase (luciferase family)